MTYRPHETDLSIWSDMRKDAYGCRPRYHDGTWPSEESFNAEMAQLQTYIDWDMRLEREGWRAALAEFEAELDELQTRYDLSRADAFRWKLQAEDRELRDLDDAWQYCRSIGANTTEAPRLLKILEG